MEPQKLFMEKIESAGDSFANSLGAACNDGTLNHAGRGKEVTEGVC